MRPTIKRVFQFKGCFFCRKNIEEIDFRDPGLSRFLSSWAKIKTRKETGLCAKHQRRLAQAIKRARFLGLLPYVGR